MAVTAVGAVSESSASGARPGYPVTRAEVAVDRLHGVELTDPYRWLEDARSSEVQSWMTAQNRAARAELDRLPGREPFVNRLKSLLYVDSISAPVVRGDRFFYSRRLASKEKPILYWKVGEQGEERVLLDPNVLSADGSVALGVWAPSWDGRKLAYSLRRNNADEATMHVMDVSSGEVSKIDVIPGARYASPSWKPDGSGFYYINLPSDPGVPVDQRPGYAEGRYHELGSDPKSDPLVFPALRDPQKFVGIALSRSGRFLFRETQHGWNQTDVYYRDLSRGETEWRTLVAGKPAIYQLEEHGGSFYVLTNEGAPRYRVFKVNPNKAERGRWKEVVAERPDAVVDGMSVIGGRLVLTVMLNATSRIEIRKLDGSPASEVETPGLGSSSAVVGEPNRNDVYFTFASFTRPPEVHRASARTGKSSVWARPDLKIDDRPFTVEQVWYPSKDGTKISMFIVHRKDMKKDGSTPLLLEGYGGFNVSMTPSFSASRLAWLEAGGAYALPNLRGGGEYGEAWHRAGMLDKKQNVFDDFIGAAEYLIREKFTSSQKLAIRGGSNGGLLVGAAMTQRPELFRAVICGVPLLDMVRYHLFGSGRTWIAEYGSAEDASQFRTLYGYSPYHRVKKGADYPALLMQSADSDDRVDPMHARKMVALIQASTGSDRPVLLTIEKNAGHGGAGLIKAAIEQATDSYLFLMQQLGLPPLNP